MNSGNPSLRLLMHFLEHILLQDRLLWGECFNEVLQGSRVRNFQLTVMNRDIFKDTEGYEGDQEVVLPIPPLCWVGGIQNTAVMPLVSVAALMSHQISYWLFPPS